MACAIAFEFYVSKNFAGRYLAKLRWATYVVDGKTYYYFESMPKDGVSKADNIVFWAGMWFSAIYYPLIALGSLLLIKFVDAPIYILGAFAGIMNLIAYIRCSKDAQKKMKSMASDMASKAGQAYINN